MVDRELGKTFMGTLLESWAFVTVQFVIGLVILLKRTGSMMVVVFLEIETLRYTVEL